MTATLPDRVVAHMPSARELADSLEFPEGWRAEIIGGTIVMSPSPSGKHARTLSAIHTMLSPGLPGDHEAVMNLGVDKEPGSGDFYIPDLLVAPVDVLDTWDSEVPPDDVLLMCEVVSKSNPDNDRVVKLKYYAVAGIPFYLLVDPLQAEIKLYSDPVKGEYRAYHRVEWGEGIALPDPFNTVLDTSQFPKLGA